MSDLDWRAEERVPIPRMVTPADWVTLGNGLLGVLAILAAQTGQVRAAYTLILLALVFDGVDGLLARRGHGEGRLGPGLDSLCDLVSFVVAPAVLFWHVYGTRAWLPGGTDASLLAGAFLVFAACAFYFGAGVLRLARFDYLRGGDRSEYFLGVATPAAAAAVASISLLAWDTVASLAIVAVLGVLMASRVRLPKLRGAIAIVGALVVLAAALVGDDMGFLGPTLILSFAVAYLLVGPVYVRRRDDADEPQWA